MRLRPLLLLTASAAMLVIAASTTGCSKGDTGPAGPAGPALKGTLVGYVILADEFGTNLVNRENVLVKAGTLTAVTNQRGRFEIRDLPTGTYNIELSRPGFGTYQLQGFQFLGGDVPAQAPTIIMAQRSTTEVSELRLSVVGTGPSAQVYVEGIILPAPTDEFRRGARFFISDTSSVSSTSYRMVAYTECQTSAFKRPLFWTTIEEAGFRPGTMLYVVGHGDALASDNWMDIANDHMVYPAINATPSNVASVLLPN